MANLNMYFDKAERAWKPVVGSTWGRLKVLEILNHGTYKCLCECGAIVPRKHKSLTQKQTVSCGCWHREKIGLRFRKEDTAFKDLLCSYRKGARERGLEWSLTEEQFRTLTSSPCHYTGRLPAKAARSCATNRRARKGLPPFSGGTYLYNGIDRLDSSKGYTLDNCVPACEDANKAKLELSYDEFIALCKEIAIRHQ